MGPPDFGSNEHMIEYILPSVHAAIGSASTGLAGSADPISELDSHANMVVLGHNAFIFEGTGRTCNAQPFADELGVALNIPIVDGAVAYV